MQNLDRNQKIIIILVVVIIIIVIATYLNNTSQETFEEQQIYTNEYENTVEENKIIIHITGAVVEEGIVELTEGQRLSDAIDKAGGITQDADISKINLAYKLEDGQKIYIPYITDDVSTEGIEIETESYYEDMTSQKTSSLININKATQQELETLPGIGTITAEKIIAYRNENGKFKSIEDIQNVSGIGKSKFESIKDLICI